MPTKECPLSELRVPFCCEGANGCGHASMHGWPLACLVPRPCRVWSLQAAGGQDQILMQLVNGIGSLGPGASSLVFRAGSQAAD